jgi:hypothetical protein
MQQMFLVLHLFGAIMLFSLMGVAVVQLLRGQAASYATLSQTMAWNALIQAMTGSLLAVSAQMPVGSYCAKIGLYMSLTMAVEVMLLWRMGERRSVLPVLVGAGGLSLLLVLLTIHTLA